MKNGSNQLSRASGLWVEVTTITIIPIMVRVIKIGRKIMTMKVIMIMIDRIVLLSRIVTRRRRTRRKPHYLQ